MTAREDREAPTSRWLSPSVTLSIIGMVGMTFGWWGIFSARIAVIERNTQVLEQRLDRFETKLDAALVEGAKR